MDVTLMFVDGCPSWATTDRHLQALTDEFDLQVRYQVVNSPQEADELEFRGSPTVLIDGRDPFATGDDPAGLACRLYQTPHGPARSPTLEQLRAVLTLPEPDNRRLQGPTDV